MPKYQVLYWHNIPLQVRVKEGRTRTSKELPQRFQVAVDNASMEAGLTGDQAYLDLLRWTPAEERPGTPEEILAAVIDEVIEKHPKIDWRSTAAELKNS
jgi:hypothetical protein